MEDDFDYYGNYIDALESGTVVFGFRMEFGV